MRLHHLRALVALSLGLAAGQAAAFVTAPAPPGFVSTPTGGWLYTPPTPTAQLNSIIRGPGPSINLGPAGTLTRPVAYRIGSGAAAVLARAAFRSPLGLGVTLGAWLLTECVEYKGGAWMMTCGTGASIDTNEYTMDPTWGWSPNPTAACQAWAGKIMSANSYATVKNMRAEEQPDGNFKCKGDLETARAAPQPPLLEPGYYDNYLTKRLRPGDPLTDEEELDEQEMAEIMAPAKLPNIMPPVAVPVEFPPVWNPDDQTVPGSKPVRVPVGDPVLKPNSNPAEWTQPATDVRHAPTTSEPWRFDVKPVDVPVTGPNAGLDTPGDLPSEGGGPGAPPTPAEHLGLCTEFPDIAACQKMGTIDAVPVTNTEVPLSITPDGGFPTGGQCPADKVMNILGGSYALSMQPMCDFAVAIRPLLIGFAWLSAAMLFLGIARKDD